MFFTNPPVIMRDSDELKGEIVLNNNNVNIFIGFL